jgi:hypothetical protein
MFCSSAYAGERRNPSWYIKPGIDPVREVLELYDHIIGSVRRRFPQARFMLATGLHQDPHEKATYYWRLRQHDQFLRKIGVKFASVEALMSRDFLVRFDNSALARVAQLRLESARAHDGAPLFEVDNRGADLFAMLVYPDPIGPGFAFAVGSEAFEDLAFEVVFVAIKNGKHNGVGYFLDAGSGAGEEPTEFPLTTLSTRIAEAVLGPYGAR